MGNCLLNACPVATVRFLSWSWVRATFYESVEDSALLCANTPDVPSNGDTETVIVDKRANSVPVRRTLPKKILREYVNFSFLTDDEIASWILCTRFMFIMRGPSGSGKSYVAECIRSRFPTTNICSADNFWYLDSGGQEYQFDRRRLGEAHQWCQNLTHEAAQSGTSPLVIDNTNIRVWETDYYTQLGHQFGYTVIMVSPQTPWRFDTEALSMRGVHLVPPEIVEGMVRNFEPIFPLYYGLMWPGLEANIGKNVCGSQIPVLGSTAKTLTDWAWNAFTTLVNLPDIRIYLTNAFGLSDNAPLDSILDHWQSTTVPAFGCNRLASSLKVQPPHITMRYAGYGRAPGAHYYGLSEVVGTSLLSRLFTVQVTGLFVSLRTVGIRVRLPLHDPVLRQLWASDDQAKPSIADQSQSQVAGAAALIGSDKRLRRSRPLGCRAHVTLAVTQGISPVETGFDLLRVVDAELANRPGEHMAVLPSGSVRRVTVQQPATSPTADGRDYPLHCPLAPPGHEYIYVLDLDSPQHHRVLFAGAY